MSAGPQVDDAVAGEAVAGGTSVEEANKALARRWFREGWVLGNLDAADEIFAPGFVLGGRRVGPEGPKRSVAARRTAFADMSVDVQLQVAEGELVVTRFTTRARHIGTYSGVPATGKWITSSGIVMWRVVDGLVAEDWNVFDRWGVVAQLDPSIGSRSTFAQHAAGPPAG